VSEERSRRLPPRSERLILQGPAGGLEALIETPVFEGAPERPDIPHFGVICHPHPLYGGAMDNKVVYTLARAFQAEGAPTIRFNFRGVGSSAGGHDEGRGETEDALAVVAHGRQRWPAAELWLAGFSFGGGVAIRAARRAGAARLVSVAPAVSGEPAWPDCPWLIVQAEPDDVVDPATLRAQVRGLSPAPVLTVLQGAGHFFHGRLPELTEAVVQFLRSRSAA
jgi:uncharacterized protein